MTPLFNLKEAIIKALTTLGGSGKASEVKEYIRSKYGKDWKDIEKIMDDLSIESKSSFFLSEDRVLTKIEQNKYALRETPVPEMPDRKVTNRNQCLNLEQGEWFLVLKELKKTCKRRVSFQLFCRLLH